MLCLGLFLHLLKFVLLLSHRLGLRLVYLRLGFNMNSFTFGHDKKKHVFPKRCSDIFSTLKLDYEPFLYVS